MLNPPPPPSQELRRCCSCREWPLTQDASPSTAGDTGGPTGPSTHFPLCQMFWTNDPTFSPRQKLSGNALIAQQGAPAPLCHTEAFAGALQGAGGLDAASLGWQRRGRLRRAQRDQKRPSGNSGWASNLGIMATPWKPPWSPTEPSGGTARLLHQTSPVPAVPLIAPGAILTVSLSHKRVCVLGLCCRPAKALLQLVLQHTKTRKALAVTEQLVWP